ncbi:transmembrane protein C2orf18-like [Tropilaelaps mercedesae]|uniref:Transmembrane protein C2orf18-like n=1 Tax=Tropilaelaps mercedesae TaxID=418985 RepID=A0A1V9WYJ3_9ACAR|nr:transmembrane protein C2orf18-like [Tropilaelaps mercedesae]
MAWTKYQLFLAGLLVVTGSINTLATKYADTSRAVGRPDKEYWNGSMLLPTDEEHEFNHPFLQATGMFIGEFSCLILFKLIWFVYALRKTPAQKLPDILQGNQNFSPWIFYLPALCDMVATSVMYVGLFMTYPASFQMFRGAVIVFTGLFSMIFLKRRLFVYKWVGILLVLGGLAILGVADMETTPSGEYTTSGVITGDLLIIVAQVVSAGQMVLEEKFVSQRNVPPLQAVGWEGLFGMCTLGLILIPMYFIPKHGVPFEDSIDGIYQIGQSRDVAGGFFGTMISISFSNFAGVSITKQLSATTRMVLDSVRTIVIWAVSLAMGTQKFQPITIAGFAVMLIGMATYNNIFFVPFMVKRGWIRDPEKQ